MTLDDLDRVLIAWKTRTDAAAAGLVELRSLPSYEILTGGHDGRQLQLTGPSAQRGIPALQALDQAWRDYGTLSSAYQQALSLRRQMPRFSGVGEKIAEIQRVLNIEPLYNRMAQSFEAGKAGLLEIDAAWKKLDGKIGVTQAFLDGHRGETAAGIPQLRAMMETIRPRVMSDPLGVCQIFESQIEPVFLRSRAAMAKLEEQRRSLGADLVKARNLFVSLGLIREQNDQAFQECRDKISGRGAPEQPLALPRMNELEARLKRLGESAKNGQAVDAVCSELEGWIAEVKHLVDEEQAALDRNRVPLDLRRELRGRLSALRAKAAARGMAEDSKLVSMAAKAAELLHARPTPIEEASWLVSQYEARLNGRA
jgi:hypothetical protein